MQACEFLCVSNNPGDSFTVQSVELSFIFALVNSQVNLLWNCGTSMVYGESVSTNEVLKMVSVVFLINQPYT